MEVMRVLALALGTPSSRVKVATPLKPKLPNVLRAVRNPCIRFACAACNLAWDSHALSCKQQKQKEFNFPCLIDISLQSDS